MNYFVRACYYCFSLRSLQPLATGRSGREKRISLTELTELTEKVKVYPPDFSKLIEMAKTAQKKLLGKNSKISIKN
jgi:hypothetical protein